MKLRVGVVGLGTSWDSRFAPALRALSDRFEVRAVCEPVSHLAENAAQQFDAQSVHGYRVLSAREDIDAILLLSDQWYGGLPILAACDAGKALYCAAPLEMSAEEAARIKNRVEGAGIAFMAEFPCRQAPATLRLKELIATHLGHPQLVFCHHRHPADGKTSALHELIQMVDWCRYVVGRDPTSVIGTIHETGREDPAEDYEMMSLDFSGSGPSPTLAQLSCGSYISPAWKEAVSFRPPAGMQVACQRGMAFIDLPSTLIWFDKAGRHMESLDSERPVGEQLLLSFYRSVTSLVLNSSNLEDAFQAVAIVIQARVSHAEGRRIELEA